MGEDQGHDDGFLQRLLGFRQTHDVLELDVTALKDGLLYRQLAGAFLFLLAVILLWLFAHCKMWIKVPLGPLLLAQHLWTTGATSVAATLQRACCTWYWKALRVELTDVWGPHRSLSACTAMFFGGQNVRQWRACLYLWVNVRLGGRECVCVRVCIHACVLMFQSHITSNSDATVKTRGTSHARFKPSPIAMCPARVPHAPASYAHNAFITHNKLAAKSLQWMSPQRKDTLPSWILSWESFLGCRCLSLAGSPPTQCNMRLKSHFLCHLYLAGICFYLFAVSVLWFPVYCKNMLPDWALRALLSTLQMYIIMIIIETMNVSEIKVLLSVSSKDLLSWPWSASSSSTYLYIYTSSSILGIKLQMTLHHMTKLHQHHQTLSLSLHHYHDLGQPHNHQHIYIYILCIKLLA